MMNVVIGSYQELLLGYRLLCDQNGLWKFQLRFTDDQHFGCIQSVAISEDGTYLATGGTDESLRLFQLRRYMELGSLPGQKGAVTSLEFFNNRFLLCTSTDGFYRSWSVQDFELKAVLPGHKGAAISGALHPSGKLALTVGEDRKLKTWNIAKGRLAFTSKLGEKALSVKWSKKGEFYALLFDKHVDVFKTSGCKLVIKLTSPAASCVSSALFFDDTTRSYSGIMCGFSNGTFTIARLRESDSKQDAEEIESDAEQQIFVKLHSCRVKQLCLCELDSQQFVVSASSDGQISLWSLPSLMEAADLRKKIIPRPLASVHSGVRITAMAVAKLPAKLETKMAPKQKEDEKQILNNNENKGETADVVSNVEDNLPTNSSIITVSSEETTSLSSVKKRKKRKIDTVAGKSVVVSGQNGATKLSRSKQPVPLEGSRKEVKKRKREANNRKLKG